MTPAAHASELWCPMVQFRGSNTGGQLGPRAPMDASCVADRCAMWRWAESPFEKSKPKTWWPQEDEPHVEPERPATVPASAYWVPLTDDGENIEGGFWEQPQAEVDAEYASQLGKRRGYCGLAGRQEVLP